MFYEMLKIILAFVIFTGIMIIFYLKNGGSITGIIAGSSVQFIGSVLILLWINVQLVFIDIKDTGSQI